MFLYSKKELQALRKAMKKLPRQLAAAHGMTINSAAFGVRTIAIQNIHNDGIVRNPAFVRSRMRVQKTPRGPIHSQQSRVGSIKADRFSGWIEQETGETRPRPKYFSTDARSGSFENQVKRAFRLDKNFFNVADWKPKNVKGSRKNRTIAALQMLGREAYRKPFLLYGHNKLPSGLYKFRKPRKARKGSRQINKLDMLASFKKPAPTRRTRWLSRALKTFLKTDELPRMWKFSLNKIMKPKKLK